MSGSVITGLIGHPVSHSKSPLIHNYWIEKYGLKGHYTAVDIAPEDLESGLRALIEKGFTGFNVTVPHKESMLRLCDHVEKSAATIGAVNTVYIQSGKLHGFNTDAFGFVQNIKTAVPEFSFAGGPVVLLGAGGAARAVLYALTQEGTPQIYLTNRTRERAAELQKNFKDDGAIEIIDWEKRAEILENAALLVNSTTLGMTGQAPLEMDLRALPQTALVNDLVYAPLKTNLLKRAAEKGCRTVDGIGMLLHQARPGFEKWYGVLPALDKTLEEIVLR